MQKTGLVIVLAISTALAEGDLSYHADYAIIQQADTEIDDLWQPIYLNVRGSTVFEGIQEILSGTGYRLAHSAAADPDIQKLYDPPDANSKRRVRKSPLSLHSVQMLLTT